VEFTAACTSARALNVLYLKGKFSENNASEIAQGGHEGGRGERLPGELLFAEQRGFPRAWGLPAVQCEGTRGFAKGRVEVT